MNITMINAGNSEEWDFDEKSTFLAFNHETKKMGTVVNLVIDYDEEDYSSWHTALIYAKLDL